MLSAYTILKYPQPQLDLPAQKTFSEISCECSVADKMGWNRDGMKTLFEGAGLAPNWDCERYFEFLLKWPIFQ